MSSTLATPHLAVLALQVSFQLSFCWGATKGKETRPESLQILLREDVHLTQNDDCHHFIRRVYELAKYLSCTSKSSSQPGNTRSPADTAE